MGKEQRYIISETLINPYAFRVTAQSKTEAENLAERGLAIPIITSNTERKLEARLDLAER